MPASWWMYGPLCTAPGQALLCAWMLNHLLKECHTAVQETHLTRGYWLLGRGRGALVSVASIGVGILIPPSVARRSFAGGQCRARGPVGLPLPAKGC